MFSPSQISTRVKTALQRNLVLTILHSGFSQLLISPSSSGSDWVDTVVESGGMLCSRKGVNLPGCDLVGLQAVSERDEADLRFGVAQGVDIVFASFIRSAQDVKDVRRVLGPHGQSIKVISKVESRQGVQK